jgi:hypothetical protein
MLRIGRKIRDLPAPALEKMSEDLLRISGGVTWGARRGGRPGSRDAEQAPPLLAI